ncbi:MAG: zinc ribbon domain-containing protein [Micrococcaceae bacterium]
MNFCMNCGNDVSRVKFCTKCGTKVEVAEIANNNNTVIDATSDYKQAKTITTTPKVEAVASEAKTLDIQKYKESLTELTTKFKKEFSTKASTFQHEITAYVEKQNAAIPSSTISPKLQEMLKNYKALDVEKVFNKK